MKGRHVQIAISRKTWLFRIKLLLVLVLAQTGGIVCGIDCTGGYNPCTDPDGYVWCLTSPPICDPIPTSAPAPAPDAPPWCAGVCPTISPIYPPPSCDDDCPPPPQYCAGMHCGGK